MCHFKKEFLYKSSNNNKGILNNNNKNTLRYQISRHLIKKVNLEKMLSSKSNINHKNLFLEYLLNTQFRKDCSFRKRIFKNNNKNTLKLLVKSLKNLYFKTLFVKNNDIIVLLDHLKDVEELPINCKFKKSLIKNPDHYFVIESRFDRQNIILSYKNIKGQIKSWVSSQSFKKRTKLPILAKQGGSPYVARKMVKEQMNYINETISRKNPTIRFNRIFKGNNRFVLKRMVRYMSYMHRFILKKSFKYRHSLGLQVDNKDYKKSKNFNPLVISETVFSHKKNARPGLIIPPRLNKKIEEQEEKLTKNKGKGPWIKGKYKTVKKKKQYLIDGELIWKRYKIKSFDYTKDWFREGGTKE